MSATEVLETCTRARRDLAVIIPSRTSSALKALENTGPGTGGAMPGCHGGRFIGGAGAEAIAALAAMKVERSMSIV